MRAYRRRRISRRDSLNSGDVCNGSKLGHRSDRAVRHMGHGLIEQLRDRDRRIPRVPEANRLAVLFSERYIYTPQQSLGGTVNSRGNKQRTVCM